MPGKRPDPKPTPRRWLFKIALPGGLVVLFLGGLIVAGRLGLEHLRGRDRYRIEFQKIDCNPPAGMDRVEFLEEVRFESRLPAQLDLLDEELPDQLRAGFAKHRWVESVESVEIKPPRHVVVKLTYRAKAKAKP